MQRKSPSAPAAPLPGPALPGLEPAALRLLACCRQYHGQAIGLSQLARRAGLGREECGELLHELWLCGLVWYRSATEPLLAPALRATTWRAVLLHATATPWAVARQYPVSAGIWQMESAATGFATEKAAARHAASLNYAGGLPPTPPAAPPAMLTQAA
ncbi:hypothetical protein HER32_16835 [Hymenobacter sp. BT18]|uniref:hypothetical protein n=1 Tax=Hymenobacter sp. BT18 TaxID=2835648 RepID=UPI00143EB8EE|nr:hypothetical protein [Hymenobacter sp. BT18]QIX62748.1 hypothetical protein HER32_16835 [Hymenobacter sp. BT18]